MNEAKFTKGPWDFNDARINSEVDHGFYGADGSLVMDFGDDDPDQMYGQAPNAYDTNLIAVAPEMYELLERQRNIFLRIADNHDGNETFLFFAKKEAESIDQLLAKARGEK
jgi:hypothetical protein